MTDAMTMMLMVLPDCRSAVSVLTMKASTSGTASSRYGLPVRPEGGFRSSHLSLTFSSSVKVLGSYQPRSVLSFSRMNRSAWGPICR